MNQDFRHTKSYQDYQRFRLRLRRLGMIRALVAIGFVLLWACFWYLQIVRGPEYRVLAEENRLHHRVQRALRGAITDNAGVVMVTNRPTFAVYLAPERTKSAEKEVRRLAQIVGEDPQVLVAQLEKARRVQARYQPVLLMADVDLETAARIEARRLDTPAIDVEMAAKRSYVMGNSAAHVLGYVSEASEDELKNRRDLTLGDRVGRTGAERAYDAELRGVAGIALEEVNAAGRPLGVVGTQRAPKNGRALRLTLDAEMQKDLVEAFGDNIGAAIFIDPWTGGVKALYSAPAFDPNVFGGRLSPAAWKEISGNPDRPMHNRAISSAYNPGSTFKVVMGTAALEEGVTTPGERLFCGGSGMFYGRAFMCWKKGGHGGIGVQDAITQSCNVFFYNMGKRLGAERLYKWAHAFGCGEPSGLKFDHESLGLVPNDEWSRKHRKQPIYPGEVISMAIGQGLVQLPPYQNAVVAAAIANGGYRVFPHMVDRPGDAPEPVKIGISPATLAVVTEGMRNVVESAWGTAGKARVKGYELAGKTGTAQTISREATIKKKDNAWFMGFGPVGRPQVAWAIVVEAGGHGGDAAAPIAGLVMKRYLERQERLGPRLNLPTLQTSYGEEAVGQDEETAPAPEPGETPPPGSVPEAPPPAPPPAPASPAAANPAAAAN